MKKNTKKIIISALAMSAFALFTAVTIIADVGQLPYKIMPLALQDVFAEFGYKISIGMAFFIINNIVIFISWFLFPKESKRHPMNPVVNSVIFSALIDFWLYIAFPQSWILLGQTHSIQIRAFVFAIGIIGIAYSFNYIAFVRVFHSAIDYFTIAISHRSKLTFGQSILWVQIFSITIGIILSSISGIWKHFGIIGISTALVIGKIISWMQPFALSGYKKIMNETTN